MWPILTDWRLYAVLLGISLFAYGIIRSVPFVKKIPIINNKRNLMMASLVGLVLTSGFLTTLGTGSFNRVQSGVGIDNLQITTTFLTDAGGTVSENSNQDDLLDLRFTDAQANETASVYELDTGLLTVTRFGSLEANSCAVRCIVPPRYEDESAPNGNTYSILEEDNLGVPECYLANGAQATTSSPKQTTTLAFAEGDADQTLGIALEVDEEGHDALDQYSYKDVIIDVCGKPFTARIHRMDA